MRSTIIETLDLVAIVVPNSKFIESSVINWSCGDPRVRVHCPVGVAYGSDIAKVKAALLSVANENREVLKEPVPEVHFLSFGDSALNFELLAWTGNAVRQFALRSDLNFAIDAAFRKSGVEIPFPQRDLNLKATPAAAELLQSILKK
jgi:small-conductance mechanosensitive channel